MKNRPWHIFKSKLKVNCHHDFNSAQTAEWYIAILDQSSTPPFGFIIHLEPYYSSDNRAGWHWVRVTSTCSRGPTQHGLNCKLSSTLFMGSLCRLCGRNSPFMNRVRNSNPRSEYQVWIDLGLPSQDLLPLVNKNQLSVCSAKWETRTLVFLKSPASQFPGANCLVFQFDGKDLLTDFRYNDVFLPYD